jgi:hypothetical protein
VDPWTRDGKIRADVSKIAPDVPGLVTEVDVRDNQFVHRGQVLFVVDPPRYRFAAEQAAANVASQEAILAEAKREAARDVALGTLVSVEQRQQSSARVQEDAASPSPSWGPVTSRGTRRCGPGVRPSAGSGLGDETPPLTCGGDARRDLGRRVCRRTAIHRATCKRCRA